MTLSSNAKLKLATLVLSVMAFGYLAFGFHAEALLLFFASLLLRLKATSINLP